MQFKRLGLPLVMCAVMAVAACQSLSGKERDSSAAIRKAARKCTALGYKPGTDAYATCVLDQGHETAYARERAISEQQVCLAANADRGGSSADRAAAAVVGLYDDFKASNRCKR
jgi:hypothetical protein